jgi:hypothetical protein
MVPQRIIWHHSGTNIVPYGVPEIDRDHKKRGFPKSELGYFVGYHYVIAQNGHVWQTRKEDEIGAHDTGENVNSLGICLLGNFSEDLPQEPQIASAVRLLAEIRGRWKIPITRIEPHRWDDDTECPGKRLADNWLTTEYLQREGDALLRLFHWLGARYNLL